MNFNIMNRLLAASFVLTLIGFSQPAQAQVSPVDQVVIPAKGALINVSTRGKVGSGEDVMIVGFIIKVTPKRVLLRAVGPGLERFAIKNFLADPKIELRNANGDLLQTNSGWMSLDSSTRSDMMALAGATGAFALQQGSRDAALMVNFLPPGSYTAVISSSSGQTGVALAEVYEMADYLFLPSS
jgi:hypothetical protein